MRFKILGVKGNSVRVRSGIITIDVKVIEGDGLKIELPPFIYIANNDEWLKLRDAVVASYINSTLEINSRYETERQHVSI